MGKKLSGNANAATSMNSQIMIHLLIRIGRFNFDIHPAPTHKKLPKLKVILYGTSEIKKKNDLNMQKLIKCINI